MRLPFLETYTSSSEVSMRLKGFLIYYKESCVMMSISQEEKIDKLSNTLIYP